MKKKEINISFASTKKLDLRAPAVDRKRVNVVLDEDIHEESVKLADSLRMDFSTFLNLMLEAALSAEERDNMISSMYAAVLRRHGYLVTKDSVKENAKIRREQRVKRRKDNR